MADADPGPTEGNGKMDERVSIPLDPKTALKALMAVDPAEVNGKPNGTKAKARKRKPAKS
ncbi:MAG: hypothetical protein QOE06_2813 [Thermoleophilaceae bacterium]|jgi:hypothetical protein|nr:hypothetical protein [Thermoleophilaceae bacterium]